MTASRVRSLQARTATVLVILLAAGCASNGTHPLSSGDAITDVRNPDLPVSSRVKAVERAWLDVEAGRIDRAAARNSLKALAWSDSTHASLRLAALDVLVTDTNPEGAADAREMVRLMLPREKNQDVIAYISNAAVKLGWTDQTPALVRSLSRPSPTIKDRERPEYAALLALHPDQSIEQIVYDVFVHPPKVEGVFEANWAQRTRADAWDLLGRTDADGAVRSALLTGSQDGGEDKLVADMRVCLDELGAIPLTGEELKWITSLRDWKATPANQAWWAEAATAVTSVEGDRRQGLRLRHAEPIRWAVTHRPGWLRATRQDLVDELRGRLRERHVYSRSGEGDSTVAAKESLSAWQDRLPWGDLLSMLVVDEALHDAGVRAALFTQEGLDRADETTEYGGLIEPVPTDAGDGFRAVLYPPRPVARQGDAQFVASAEMMAAGDRALAHYHLHAQKPRNSVFAGPSQGDLGYAMRTGRACVVFTSIRPGVLDADWYGPGGVVVDLGEVSK
jgi:hypothetical protein